MLAVAGADDTNNFLTQNSRNEMQIGFREVSPDKTFFNQGRLFSSMTMFTYRLLSLWYTPRCGKPRCTPTVCNGVSNALLKKTDVRQAIVS